jgi:acyl-CoA synthetase (AMP-forming)/AMP-acid ligase II
VRSAVVIGLPDADGRERVHAIIDTAGRPLDLEELRRLLHAQLSSFQVPRSFELCSGPLRDTAGKAPRAQLRAARIERGASAKSAD